MNSWSPEESVRLNETDREVYQARPRLQSGQSSQRFLVWTLGLSVVLLGFALLALKLDLGFWFMDHREKFHSAFQRDWVMIESKLPEGFRKVRAIEVTSNGALANQWVEKWTPPIASKSDGGFTLRIFVADFFEGARVMSLVQFRLIENATGDQVQEISRTLKLGWVW